MKRPSGILSLLLIASLVFALACGDGNGEGEEEGALSPATVAAAAGTPVAAGSLAVVPTVTPPPTEPFPDLTVRDLLRITGGISPPLGDSFQEHGYAFQLFEMFSTVEEALTGPEDNPKAQEAGKVRERSSGEVVAARPVL